MFGIQQENDTVMSSDLIRLTVEILELPFFWAGSFGTNVLSFLKSGTYKRSRKKV